MTTISQDLQALGLTQNQTDVYLVLVRKGNAKAGELIDATGFHRNIVYTSLNDLEKMKLITKTSVRGIALYKALSPSRLVAQVEEKRHIAESVAEELSNIQKKNPQEVVIYEGLEEFRRHAIRSFDISSRGTTLRYLGVSPYWHTIIDSKTEQKLLSLHKEKKLILRGIAMTSFSEVRPWVKSTGATTKLKYNQLIGSDTNNIEILEDRICIQSFIEPYLVVEIINKEMAKNYQRYFDFLWEQSSN